MKNSREWIESRVSDIERFYPMDTLYDAFEHLPEGFEFRFVRIYSEEGQLYSKWIELFGISSSETIDGMIVVKKLDEKGNEIEIVEQSDLEYLRTGELQVINKEYPRELYPPRTFLFQQMDMDSLSLKSIENVSTYYNGNQSYSIIYKIEEMEQFSNLFEDDILLVRFKLGGNEYEDDTGYWRYLTIDGQDNFSYTESFKGVTIYE